MQCPGCGSQQRGRFCGGCGTALPAAIRLMLDVTPIADFREGRRCALRFAVATDGGEEVEVALEVRTTAHAAALVDSGTATPGSPARLSVGFVPDQAGHHELSGVITARDPAGSQGWRFDDMALFIGDRSAPVQVDLSSLRVATFDGAGFGATPGRILGEGDWRDVPLVAEAAVETVRIQSRRRTWTVTGTLATGDVATVYAAHHDVRGRRQDAVIKIARDAADNDLIRTEARVLRLLHARSTPQRKHIPKLIDQLRHGDREGNVIARCDGVDLLTVRARYPDGVNPRHAVWMFRRCLSALGLAHGRGLLHGNLEPAHILVRPHDHNVWLLDWTCAVEGPDGRFVLAHPPWTAPEVEQGAPPRPTADLYALGRCMAFALGAEPGGPPPDTVPEPLRRFVGFFVKESPMQRPRDAWEMYHQLDRLREQLWGPHRFLHFEV